MKIKLLYLLNVVLIIVLLTSILANATINRSATADVGKYDPWVDYDDNGLIDIFDVVAVGIAFGTTGDPTKNVNVTNFPTEMNVTIVNWQIKPEPKTIIVFENYTVTSTGDDGKYIAFVNVEGYKYVSIFVAYYRPYTDSVGIECYPSCLNITSGYSCEPPAGTFHSAAITTGQNSTLWGYRCYTGFEVRAPYLGIKVYVHNDSVELSIVLYLYNRAPFLHYSHIFCTCINLALFLVLRTRKSIRVNLINKLLNLG
jgi:hypothetical protein